LAGDRNLGKLESDGAGVADNARADLSPHPLGDP